MQMKTLISPFEINWLYLLKQNLLLQNIFYNYCLNFKPSTGPGWPTDNSCFWKNWLANILNFKYLSDPFQFVTQIRRKSWRKPKIFYIIILLSHSFSKLGKFWMTLLFTSESKEKNNQNWLFYIYLSKYWMPFLKVIIDHHTFEQELTLWQYGLWSFQAGCTKLEIF